MEDLEVPANLQFRFLGWALDFVRSMQKDVKTMIPDRTKDIFYEFDTFCDIKSGYCQLKANDIGEGTLK